MRFEPGIGSRRWETRRQSLADITFHYPPELFNLLGDAIPVLNKSKRDVLLFFQGACRRT